VTIVECRDGFRVIGRDELKYYNFFKKSDGWSRPLLENMINQFFRK
jgi:hypothetical protein